MIQSRFLTPNQASEAIENQKEYVMSILETNLFTSFSVMNIKSGEVHLCQFQDGFNLSVSSSLVSRFTPKQVITSESCKNSVVFTSIKNEFTDVQFYIFENSYFSSKSYKDIYAKFLNQNKQLLLLSKSCQALLYNTLCGLLQYVESQYQFTLNSMSAQLNLYQLQDFMVYDQMSLRGFHIINSSKSKDSLISQFKTITSSGFRLLKGYLVHPSKNPQIIQKRQNQVRSMIEKQKENKHFLQNLKDKLKKFKHIEQSALMMAQVHRFKKSFEERHLQIQKILYEIVRIVVLTKNVQELCDYMNLSGGNDFTVELTKLMQDDDPMKIKEMISIVCNQNVLNTLALNQQDQIEQEKILYLLESQHNQLLDIARAKYSTYQRQYREYLIQFQRVIAVDGIKYKDIQKGKGLVQGHLLVVPKKFTETQINQRLSVESDQIHILEDKGKFFHIITHKLFNLNTKHNQAVEEIINQTSYQVLQLYQELQHFSSWVFKVNQIVSQIDVIQSFAEYSLQYSVRCFPEFGSNITIYEAQDPIQRQNQKSINVEFKSDKKMHLVYDQNDEAEECLIRTGQFIILSQIGTMIPCKYAMLKCFSFLRSKLKSQVKQSIQENQSSFSSEVSHLYGLIQELKFQKSTGIILCDQLIVSSAHEENIALNLAMLEAISEAIEYKDSFFIGATNQADDLIVGNLINNLKIMVAHNDSIIDLQAEDVEIVLTEENNEEYNRNFLEKMENEFRLPQELCSLMAQKLQKQHRLKQAERLKITEQSLSFFDID